MKAKFNILTLSILSSLAITTSMSTSAAQFCREGVIASYWGDKTLENRTLGESDCIEIGAGGGANPYAGTAQNIILENGAQLSVLGYIKDSTVNSGAVVEISKNPQIAGGSYNADVPAKGSNITVNDGALVRVFAGGTLENSEINKGALVYVYSSSHPEDPSQSLNNTVNDGGKLYVYLDAQSKDTTINKGGIEYLQTRAQSFGSTVNGGRQSVMTGAIANNTTVNSGEQYVYNSGIAKGTIVNAGEQSIWDNGQAFNTTVNGGFQDILATGTATGVKLYNNGVQNIRANATAKDVEIHDNAISWIAAEGKLLGSTQIYDQGQLQIVAAASGKEAVVESVTLNDASSSVFILAGKQDDLGSHIGQLDGNGRIVFKTGTNETTGEATYAHLNIDELSGNQHFHFNTSIQDGRGDYLTIQKGSGQHQVSVADSGAEITSPFDKNLDLITDVSKGSEFELANISGLNINAVDGGTYMYELKNREDANGQTWYLTTKQDENGNEITTPGVDAVLSLGSAAIFAFNNELNNLRFRKGTLKNNEGAAGVWTRATGSKTNVATGNTHFDLEQIGTEVGIDKQIAVNKDGVAFVGGFASYGKADVKHDRGGTSNIDSYSFGVYGTYFHDSGLYLDGTLKYNRFANDLSAHSTNGQSITGDYNQNAWGGAVEGGFNTRLKHNTWVEPFVRLSYVQTQAKTLNLNNDMKADIGAQKSLASEVGIHLGKDFTVANNSTLSPYIKAAWSHEFMDNNNVWVNDTNKFETNFSGDVAKLGLGLNAQINKTFSAFSEMNYVKGSKVETPIHANLGVRYNF